MTSFYPVDRQMEELRPGLEEIRTRGAVGDILYHLVDQAGRPVSPEISGLICSIDLQDLQEMVQMGVQVVVVASGRRKAEIARAAIKALSLAESRG